LKGPERQKGRGRIYPTQFVYKRTVEKTEIPKRKKKKKRRRSKSSGHPATQSLITMDLKAKNRTGSSAPPGLLAALLIFL